MAEVLPEKQVITALCPSCGRIVPGRQLRRVEWKVPTGKEHDFICYACCFNTFPPGHKLFDQVQQWRSAHGKSVVQATAERVKKFKGKEKVEGEGVKVTIEATATLMKANDQRMLDAAMREWETGQIGHSVMGSRCEGPGCPNIIKGPIIATQPESKKRKAMWGFCSQKCLDDFHAFLIKDIKRRPVLIPKYDITGKTIVAYLQRGGGWLKPSEMGEPEFCPRCDRSTDVCDCTKAELAAFHKAGAGGARGEPATLQPEVRYPLSSGSSSHESKAPATTKAARRESGDGSRRQETERDGGPTYNSEETNAAANPAASKLNKQVEKEAAKLHKKMKRDAEKEVAGMEDESPWT